MLVIDERTHAGRLLPTHPRKVLFSQLSRMTELMRQRDYVYSKSESRSANEQTHDLPELDRLT